MPKKKPRRWISKRVKGLECKCSWDGAMQARAHRFDYCVCKASTTKGKRATVVDLPGEYVISTIFITPPPKRRR